jgi:hypothetical protein
MEEIPTQKGSYKWGVTINKAYLPNDNSKFFETQLNLIDWLRQHSSNQEEAYVRAFLGRMLFTSEKSLKKWYNATHGSAKSGYEFGKEFSFDAPKGYDDRLDHLIVFFNGIRTGSKIPEDATFGLRAAAPSLACNLSIDLQKPILWDPVEMKLV